MKDMDKYVEEKADRFMLKCPGIIGWHHSSVRKFAKDFIRTIVEECQPKVSRKYINRWADFWNDDFFSTKSSHLIPHIEEMLKEAGVGVEGE